MTTMRNERTIRLTLAYDGTDFSGWQRQPRDRSVQEELEKALVKMHGHPVSVVGAGRTDSGVHAAGQVAHFFSDIASIPAERFTLALNKLMPADVRVLRAQEAHPDFHARYDARLRRYRYFMYASSRSLPARDRYAWRLSGRPDLKKLNRLASCLRGEVDCTAFAAAKDPSENRFRYLHHAVFHYEANAIVFDVAANAFLWRMVRSLVGTLIHLERAGAGDGAMRDILESGDRSLAGATAPARGLFLWNVDYYDTPTRLGRRQPAEITTAAADSDARCLVPGVGWI
ncbi:MAG: tRNA pseudouridine(38-40) synthase TruA [Spirochaetales bacterium]|nr:MAG: tRNA pseudouridine(38-40) synthase TruA [Spirochaetales bacterium]